MKCVRLYWHDNDGRGFALAMDGLRPFERKHIAAALREVGYYDWIPREIFMIVDGHSPDDGPSRVVAAIAAQGYAVEFSGDFIPASVFANVENNRH